MKKHKAFFYIATTTTAIDGVGQSDEDHHQQRNAALKANGVTPTLSLFLPYSFTEEHI
jgi:hypothetical protein